MRPSHASTLTTDPLAYRSNELYFDDVSIAALGRDLPTPFFLFSAAQLRRNVERLRRALGAARPLRLRYCAKANHEAAILQELSASGIGLMASHRLEAELAIRCGFAPAAIAYQRPALERAEVEAAARLGVGLFHVHHLDDVELFAAVAAATGRTLDVSLRLAAGVRASLLGALNLRLGLSAREADVVARRIATSPGLRLAGINFYLGTQQASASGYDRWLRTAVSLAARWRPELGIELDEINLGGGFAAPHVRRLLWRGLWRRWLDRAAELERPAATDLPASLERRFAHRVAGIGGATPPALAAEPGRAIVGDAAVVVTTVRAVREPWVFLDASRAFLPESWLLFRRRLLAVVPRAGRRRFRHVSGAGLNTRDVIDLHRRLPPLAVGDLLVIADAGAYSISRATRDATPLPAAYLFGDDGSPRQIRSGDGLAEFSDTMTRIQDFSA